MPLAPGDNQRPEDLTEEALVRAKEVYSRTKRAYVGLDTEAAMVRALEAPDPLLVIDRAHKLVAQQLDELGACSPATGGCLYTT
jgi:hypothetical protein